MEFTSRSLFLSGAIALLALTACQSDGPRGPHSASTGGAPMTASGGLAVPDPQPMDAQAAFFGGQIGTEVMLAKSDAVWKNPGPAEGGGRGGIERGGFSAGLGGGGGGGGGGPRGGGAGGGRRGGGGGEPSQSAGEPGARPAGPAMQASNAPPVQLRLRLTNHRDQPVAIEVLDFNSELGNFAVQPTILTVPPHESLEANPMTSRLGVPAVEEIPVTVRLRVGGKSGKTETQILKLRPRPDSPPPASAP